eukprot:8578945-Prorocentrum_lima.AAC.1
MVDVAIHMKAQGLVKKENIHQIHPFPMPRVRNPTSGPFKARATQQVEDILDWNNMKNDLTMKAL